MVKNIINKLPKSIQKALTNKYILYGLILISIINIIGYVELKQWNPLALYMTTIILMSYFTKNMTIIILAAMMMGNCLVCSNMLNNYTGLESFKEGNTNARYHKKKGECVEHTEPKKENGGCKGMGCKKECKTCFPKNTCKN